MMIFVHEFNLIYYTTYLLQISTEFTRVKIEFSSWIILSLNVSFKMARSRLICTKVVTRIIIEATNGGWWKKQKRCLQNLNQAEKTLDVCYCLKFIFLFHNHYHFTAIIDSSVYFCYLCLCFQYSLLWIKFIDPLNVSFKGSLLNLLSFSSKFLFQHYRFVIEFCLASWNVWLNIPCFCMTMI